MGRLVALNSFTTHREGVNAVGDLLAAELSSLGFRISELVAGRGGRTVVARRNGDPSHRLLLLGHLDTVHPPSSPFASYVRGADGTDLATGPGAADMKGGLVVMLAALRALAEAGELDDRQVTVVLTADEETGSPSSAEIVRAEGGDADLCLCFEPGRRHDDGTTTFVTRRRGYGRLTVHVRGRAAHAGSIEDARKAMAKALASDDPAVRKTAFLAMMDFDGKDAFEDVAAVLGREQDPVVQHAAVLALGRMRSPAAADALAAATRAAKGPKRLLLLLAFREQLSDAGKAVLLEVLGGKIGRAHV